MWFEMVETAGLAGNKGPEAKLRTRRKLVERALAAYADAKQDIPEEHRRRFEQWLADRPTDAVTP